MLFKHVNIMKIITKIKDYYDYMQSVYGIDELVVYDRRVCEPLNTHRQGGEYGEEWFGENKFPWDKPKQSIRYYSTQSIITKINREQNKLPFQKNKTIQEGRIEHFILEIGYFQYLFEIERYIDDNDELVLNYHLIETRRVEKNKRMSDAPMSIAKAETRYGFFFYKEPQWEFRENSVVKNPILINTWIPKLVSPNDVWEHLYEYISSLNDKEIVDSRTNNEHIESNGFDKKTSFRGKVKKR